MLTRRHFVIGCLAGAAMAGPVWARDFASEIEAELAGQGYQIESVARTLLGRVRIVARSTEGEREIILNPRTGEILRDLWLTRDKSGKSPLLDDGKSGRDGDDDDGDDDDDDDDDDEDDDDDDDDDDNSGSGGGGNSGSGGGGDDDD